MLRFVDDVRLYLAHRHEAYSVVLEDGDGQRTSRSLPWPVKPGEVFDLEGARWYVVGPVEAESWGRITEDDEAMLCTYLGDVLKMRPEIHVFREAER